MADDRDDDASVTEAEQPKARSGRLVLVIAIIEALLIVVLVTVYFAILRTSDGGADEKLEKNAAQSEHDLEEEGLVEGESLEGERPLGAIVPLDMFVVNLQQEGFLKIRIQIGFLEREVPRLFYARQVILRDTLITLLAARTKESVSSSQGKERLREEIKEVVNAAIKKEVVDKVYFTEFAIR